MKGQIKVVRTWVILKRKQEDGVEGDRGGGVVGDWTETGGRDRQ